MDATLNTAAALTHQAAALVEALRDMEGCPTEQDWDMLINLEIAADELRGAVQDLHGAMEAASVLQADGHRGRLDVERIRDLASNDQGAPVLTIWQARQATRILASA